MNEITTTRPASATELALWGGLECTVNRVRDNYFSQMDAASLKPSAACSTPTRRRS